MPCYRRGNGLTSQRRDPCMQAVADRPTVHPSLLWCLCYERRGSHGLDGGAWVSGHVGTNLRLGWQLAAGSFVHAPVPDPKLARRGCEHRSVEEAKYCHSRSWRYALAFYRRLQSNRYALNRRADAVASAPL
eukprot:COSAG02_NODE_1342_length_13169_cov_11.075905_2_plen_132_part_00